MFMILGRVPGSNSRGYWMEEVNAGVMKTRVEAGYWLENHAVAGTYYMVVEETIWLSVVVERTLRTHDMGAN